MNFARCNVTQIQKNSEKLGGFLNIHQAAIAIFREAFALQAVQKVDPGASSM